MSDFDVLEGDSAEVLRRLAAGSVACAVTSPTYYVGPEAAEPWMPGVLGIERDPEEYLARLVAIFSGVRRGLADRGGLFVVLGDALPGRPGADRMPERLARALEANGWALRKNIRWEKPGGARVEERVLVLAKAGFEAGPSGALPSVLRVASEQPPRGFAMSLTPEELVRPLILAGSQAGRTVLDPFCGAGTVGCAALRLGRRFIGIERSKVYAAIARRRLLEAAANVPRSFALAAAGRRVTP